MPIRILGFLVCLAVSFPFQGTVFAQAKTPAPSKVIDFCKDPRSDVRAYCKDLNDLQTEENSGGSTDDTLNKLDLSHPKATPKFITAMAALSKAVASAAMQDASQGRLDRQTSPGSTTSGTTSLVSKAGSSELLSLALDTGVLTQSVNGTTGTLNTNADQIFRLITKTDPDCTVTCTSKGWFEDYFLSPVYISATLDLAQQNSNTTATSGQASGSTPTNVGSAAIPTGAGKLSGITARYRLLNRFDPRSAAFKTKWNEAVSENKLDALSVAIQGPSDDVVKVLTAPNAGFDLDRDGILQKAKEDPTGRKVADFFDSYFSNASQTAMQDKTVNSSVSKVMQARAAFRQVWFNALEQAAGDLFTFEYDYKRPVQQPITHDFKLVYARDFQTAGMLTFNGTVSIYDNVPAGAKYGRLHYGQFSAEYDQTMTGAGKSLQTQLSLAGYWQYQPHASILNIPAGTVAPGTDIPLPNGTQEFVGTAGSLWVTQAKITIKGSGGINVPIGVSWSNKTDLLQGSKVGAQVGISYNFSSLAGLFTGGTQ